VLLPEPGDPEGTAALVLAAAPGIADQLLAALGQFDGLAPIPG
jgi:myo-inositol-1(or 4)-monophosphatase